MCADKRRWTTAFSGSCRRSCGRVRPARPPPGARRVRTGSPQGLSVPRLSASAAHAPGGRPREAAPDEGPAGGGAPAAEREGCAAARPPIPLRFPVRIGRRSLLAVESGRASLPCPVRIGRTPLSPPGMTALGRGLTRASLSGADRVRSERRRLLGCDAPHHHPPPESVGGRASAACRE